MKGLFRRSIPGEAPPEGWSGPWRGPRVLVESEDLAERWAIGTILRNEGFDVIACGGPHLLEGGACPLASGQDCAAAACADAVLYCLNLPDAVNQGVLGALRDRWPGRPLVVEVPEPRAEKAGPTLAGCHVLFAPASGSEIVDAVTAAVAAGRSGTGS